MIVPIEVGSVLFAPSETSSAMRGHNRVLQISRQRDIAILIPIPCGPRLTEGKKQASYYAKGFFSARLSQLEFWLETSQLQITSIAIPSHWHLSDTQLRQLSPPGKTVDQSPSDVDRSPLEIKRDFKWMLIAPLIPSERGASGPSTPDLSSLDARVRDRAREAGVSAGQVFDALHRFYAFGCIRNALLPNTTRNSFSEAGHHSSSTTELMPSKLRISPLSAKYRAPAGDKFDAGGQLSFASSVPSRFWVT